MSYHPYRIKSIEDETRLLEKLVTLQDKVRIARENERRTKSSQNTHYTEMFEPITNSLKQLKPSQVIKADNSTNTDQSTDKPSQVIKAATSTNTDQSTDNGNIDVSNDMYGADDEDDKKPIIGEPGKLYKAALNSIPTKSKDDGVFGLNVETIKEKIIKEFKK